MDQKPAIIFWLLPAPHSCVDWRLHFMGSSQGFPAAPRWQFDSNRQNPASPIVHSWHELSMRRLSLAARLDLDLCQALAADVVLLTCLFCV